MITLRRAGATDRASLAALAEATLPGAWTEASLAAELDRPIATVLLAEQDGRALGFGITWCVADEAEILLIGVAPEARRHGLGRRLLAALEAAASAAGAVTMHLEVAARNEGARAFYAALGYLETGRRRSYYPDGDDALLLCRRLTVELRPPLA